MDLGAVSEEDLRRTPCVTAGCDPTALCLSTREGYLFSRLDGHTPWRLLREVGGMTPDEVDLCIETWLGDDVVELTDPECRPRAVVKLEAAPAVVPGQIDENELDESLDLDVEVQRRILDMQSRLGAGYAAILGVALDADRKTIKQAYRTLSRDFHPDRYFRKQIGGYKPRLEAIFKKVLEAYELLSDPETRAEVRKAMTAAPESSGLGRDGALPPASQRPLTSIERLRRRMPFRLPASILNERRAKARSFYDSARSWAEGGQPLEAASSIRLAIAFDPFEELYKSAFAEIQAGISDGKIAGLLTASKDWEELGEVREGLKQCEEALLHRPHDPDLNETAARCTLVLGDTSAALQYAERALEHSPDVGRYHRTLAQVLSESGDKAHAIFELECALELDAGDTEAGRLLENLRPPRVVRGGNE